MIVDGLIVATDDGFEEIPSLHRSNAFDFVTQEVEAVRTAVGAYETGVYARYEVSGPDAYAWLNNLVASRIPEVGRIRLATMLHHKGTLMGDLTISRLADDRFWLVGSYYLQEWHQRWFEQNLTSETSGVTITNLTDQWLGFALSGPNSRELVSRITTEDVSDASIPFMSVRTIDLGFTDAVVGRLSLTGELGYEITVPAEHHRELWLALKAAGADLGLRPIGDRAIDSLRLEKAYGIWSTEFTQAYTPGMSGLDRFIAFDKGEFIGREAALAERETGPKQRLVLLEVEADRADAMGDEPVWHNGEVVGFVTSGSYGHHVKKSLALAYINNDLVGTNPELHVSVIGERRPARVLPEVPYDPTGSHLRG